MRAFIAIELDPSWQDLISHIQKNIHTKSVVRWVNPTQIHLTLKFIKDLYENLLPELETKLQALASILPNFDLKIDKLGAFPSVRKPEIIWLGLEENLPLTQLYQKIEENLSGLGIERETRTLRAHITIGRVKGASNKNLVNFLEMYQPQALSQRASGITLFESRLTPQGPIHTVLKHFNLATH